ncbi:uncharacterized protein LOC110995205 [Pieris rapae]|uniref:uncharacterized protein LOC110995205 n=1 Tax=Pieris rapae TaxID=64459 RepID=UPI001E2811AA|nr:uncharacterized protein LOC110995205 [Pieris rapae]
MESTTNLLRNINRCLIPKLFKNYDECSDHQEFNIRNQNLAYNFKILIECLYDINCIDFKNNPAIIALLVNLFLELSCDGPWNNHVTEDISKHLNTHFEKITSIRLDSVFKRNNIFDHQEVFNKFSDELHLKLTYESFKKYPAQIEVYYLFIKNLKGYDVAVVPSKIFPITILLVEDYVDFNKNKGLKCCTHLLQYLDSNVFLTGNYYEVIYRTLKRNLSDRDDNITNLTHSNLLMLLDILPNTGKRQKLDELYKSCLDQLSIESNLYHKVALINFTCTVIEHHKINCANRSIFKDIVCQNLDICTNNAVIDVILAPLLKCLKKWIIYCWPVWKYNTDHKLLSALLKVLYTCNEDLYKEIYNIIVTLICLCTEDEQTQILNNLNKVQEIQCDIFKEKISNIITHFA